MKRLRLSSFPEAMAIAVSGGADSMALALLASEWASAHGVMLYALTVDHGLRPESRAEAESVGQWMQAAGISHHILNWHPPSGTISNLQAQARQARYQLMARWCQTKNITHLLLAHHLDDQAETFLIRLQRGSGVDGLCAMQAVTQQWEMTLLRPFLDIPKQRLISTLQAHNQPWCEDPSNHSPHYTRSRMRALLPVLEDVGISPHTLAKTAKRMQRARDYLEAQTQQAMEECLAFKDEGYLVLDTSAFTLLHPEIAFRLLAEALRIMNNDSYRPRFADLERLHTAVCHPAAHTLSGCLFRPHQQGKTLILREPVAVQGKQDVAGHCPTEWDGRFTLYVSKGHTPHLHIAPLTQKGWLLLKRRSPQLEAHLSIPKTAIYSLPALWHLETPAAVPHMDYYTDMCPPGSVSITSFPAYKGSSR